MDRSITATLLACLLGLASCPGAMGQDSPATTLVISSGIKGGGYWSAATRLNSIAQEMGFEVEVRASTGSLDNLEQLTDADSPVNLAFTQTDALQFHLDGDPQLDEQLETLETLGQECVFIITGSNSPIHTDKDLQNPAGYRLGIGSPDSGVAVTFNYMASQIPGLQQTLVNFGDTRDAVGTLNDADSNVDAIMVVHRPKAYSVEVATALENPDSFRFVEIEGQALTGKLPDGDKVYQEMKLALPGPGDDDRTMVKTICVKGLLLANKQKLSAPQREQVHKLVNQHWARVFTTE